LLPAPQPFSIARFMLSLGSPAALAFSIAVLNLKFPAGSPPPSFDATIISLENLAKFTPRAASALAFLCLTNNGKPFHLGFPDNINISINDKKFYNTESKGFKRPLLLALENNKFYIRKRRHLITSDKYEIPNAENYFSDKNKTQKVTISFANN